MIDHRDNTGVVVYWRPGCWFCSALMRELDRLALPYERRDIWEDDEAAAFVRSVAGGNETVPTVRVGDLALINPSTPDVMRAVAEHAPELLPAGYEPPTTGRLTRALTRILGG